MLLAKLDADGNVEKFPYYNLNAELADELPSDVVAVNKSKNMPAYSWNQVAAFDSVEQVEGEWVVNYRVKDKFANEEEELAFANQELLDAANRIKENFRTQTLQLKGNYTDIEMDSWANQLAEAKAHQAGGSDTPLLSAIAEQRNMSVDDLAAKVIEKNAAYVAEYGRLLGQYSHKKKVLSEIDINDRTTWDKFNELR